MRVNKILVSIALLTIILTSCGINATSSAVNDSQTSDIDGANIEITTTLHQELSTGYVITNGEDFVELQQSINSTAVARMYHGEPITIYSISGEWANVSYGGIMGYMRLVNISYNKPVEQTETLLTTQEVITSAQEQTQSQVQEQSQNQPVVAQVQNIEQNVNLEIVFLSDNDGFQYAAPKSYPKYVADSGSVAWCSAKSVYIYAEPSTSSKKREANMLYYGDSCTILGSVDEWYYIGTDSGSGYTLHGYVKKSYITMGTTPKAPENANATQGRVKVSSANVRSSPDKSNDSNVLFSVHEGDTFTVLDYVNNYWYYINYNGTKCYISHKMVEVW